MADRFTAPWPVSLPLHGLAMAATAVLVVIVANVSNQGVMRSRLARLKTPQRQVASESEVASAKKPAEYTLRKEAAMLDAISLATGGQPERNVAEIPLSLEELESGLF